MNMATLSSSRLELTQSTRKRGIEAIYPAITELLTELHNLLTSTPRSYRYYGGYSKDIRPIDHSEEPG